MSRYARLALLQARISVASAIAYRADFVIQGVMAIVWLSLTVLPLFVLFDGRETVAGWDAGSALVVMSFFMALRAILDGVISPSISDAVHQIRSGSFDYWLLKPIDAQFVVSISRYEPWRILDFIGAIAVAIYAFVRLGRTPGVDDVALGLLLLLVGALAMYSIWLIAAALSFWLMRLDNVVYLLNAIFDAGRWPVSLFPGVWRIVFTFVIPVALMTTFPAMALLGVLGWESLVASLAGVTALLVVSRLIWLAGLRCYTSASS